MSNFWFFHKLEIWLYTKTPTRTSQKLTNHHKKLNFSLEKNNLSQKYDFTSKNIKNNESPKMTSKVLYELSLTSYEQFWFFHKLEIWLYTKTHTRTSQKLTNNHKKLNISREKSNLSQKCNFTSKNIKNSESPKMTSKVLYELLLTSYEQFLIFSQTWNLTLHKNANKDQPKTN